MTKLESNLSLKELMDQANARLEPMSVDDLRGIILAMARELQPMERRAFLGKLVVPATQVGNLKAAVGDRLAEEIAALERKLLKDMADPPEERGYYRDDDDDGETAYAAYHGRLKDFFDRARTAFDLGDYAVAEAAYRALFRLLSAEDDYGRRVSVPVEAAPEEARHRWLRALAEITPHPKRAKVLREAMREAVDSYVVPGRVSVVGIFEAAATPMAGQEALLDALIRALENSQDKTGDRWLREAVGLRQGKAGLAELARRDGKRRPRAYLDWLDAVAKEGDAAASMAVAREALQKLPAGLRLRAQVADRLTTAAIALRQPQAVIEAAWEAFLVEPGTARLLGLWEAVGEAGPRQDWMRRAARHCAGLTKSEPSSVPFPPEDEEDDDAPFMDEADGAWPSWHSPALVQACASLLAGDWTAAIGLAKQHKPLGWSDGDNVQALAVPFLLVWLAGAPGEALPTSLAKQWGNATETLCSWYNNEGLKPRLSAAFAQAMQTGPAGPAAEDEWLEWTVGTALARAKAIVDSGHRGAYDRAALLAVAAAETLARRGARTQAIAMLDGLAAAHRRKYAFTRELAAQRRQFDGGPIKGVKLR